MTAYRDSSPTIPAKQDDPLAARWCLQHHQTDSVSSSWHDSLSRHSPSMSLNADIRCHYVVETIIDGYGLVFNWLSNTPLHIDKTKNAPYPCSPWWRHQMEAFSALLAIYARNLPVTGEFPIQKPVTRSFNVSLICAWINDWVNNGEAGDLGRQCAHYDVTVMLCCYKVIYTTILCTKRSYKGIA